MREAKDVLMLDEEHSAHQFSLHDRSMQADSEERLDANNQTCLFDMKSMQGQTSMQGAVSANNQTSEIDIRSAKHQAFEDARNEMSCQTDPAMLPRAKTPVKKTVKLQTEKHKDVYNFDWAQSSVFRKAMRDEAVKRGLEFQYYVSSDEDVASTGSAGHDDCALQQQLSKALINNANEAAEMENAQDPDTDMNEERKQLENTALGFFKSYKK